MRLGPPLALVALLASSAAVSPTQVPPRVTGFFSDFAYDSETGDISGTEIFISYARIQHGFQAQHYAYVQIAEGVPAEPQLVPVTVNGTNISFTLSGRYARISPFSGAVTGDSLVGQFSNGVQIRLPRRASYWR